MPTDGEARLEASRTNPGSLMSNTTNTSDGGDDSAPKIVPEQDESEKVDQEETQATVPTSELVNILRKSSPELWHSIYSCHGDIDPKTSQPGSGEPKFTNYTAAFKNTLDYMYLRKNEALLVPTEVLTLPPEETVMPSLPNRNFGSDHMCLVSKFEFTV